MNIINSNRFGTISKLNVSIDKSSKKNILSHISFTAPFKIMNPFYDEQDNLSIMIMSCSAGIMEGDCQEIQIDIGENAKAKIFSQSYEKIHKMENGSAKRDTVVNVKRCGFLEYSPLPTIPFAGSNFVANTKIHLEDKSSKFIFSDILSAGRVALGEMSEYSLYQSKVVVYCDSKIIYFDNANYNPSMFEMSGFCLQEGYSHQSSLLLFNLDISREKLELVQEYIDRLEKKYKEEQSREYDVIGGYSVMHTGDIVLRFLGRSGEALENVHKDVIKIVT